VTILNLRRSFLAVSKDEPSSHFIHPLTVIARSGPFSYTMLCASMRGGTFGPVAGGLMMILTTTAGGDKSVKIGVMLRAKVAAPTICCGSESRVLVEAELREAVQFSKPLTPPKASKISAISRPLQVGQHKGAVSHFLLVRELTYCIWLL
jgi:hypothetical protein